MLAEVILGALLALLLWISFFKKPSGLPPGRWGLPFIGYFPLDGKTIEEQVYSLHEQYGDIILWRMGMKPIVFVKDFPLSREIFNNKVFADRPRMDLFTLGEKKSLGIFASNGLMWQTNRRFSLRQLRDQGMGKSKLVVAIQDQAHMLVEALKEQANKPAPVPHALRVAITNVIWHMISGKTYKLGDKNLIEFEQLIQDLNSATIRIGFPDFFPWLRYLPRALQTRLFLMDRVDYFREKFVEYFDETIQEHKANLDPQNPKDLMDAYLLEIEETKDNPDSLRTMRDLTFLILDLFFAGSETTTNTLTHLFYYLAMYPEVQKKFQDQIDEVLPNGCSATLDDRAKLPYVEAVINEVLRISSLVPLGVMHEATEDTQIRGYFIPKGTVVASTFGAIHFDPQYWEEPEKFMPERWLDEEGNFSMKKQGFLPFGIGRRACVGENLARMELLILSTAVFQNLNIAPPPGSSIDLTPDTTVPFFHNAKKQDIFITLR